MDRIFFLNHSPINFYFKPSPETFVVEEVPLYPFTQEGEHQILKVRKKNLTTWQMLQAFSERVGVKLKEIGYAGMKDKNALTYQYISLPAKAKIDKFSHPQIKIIETHHHKNKIKLGHLKGNRFFIRLKKVSKVDAKKIDEVIKILQEEGFPNYFGYQRFSNYNYELGKEIIEGKRKERNRKIRKFLINAYQSHLFNLWLSKRVELSRIINSFTPSEIATFLDYPQTLVKELQQQPHFFKLFLGDLMSHYPRGRLFLAQDILKEAERFKNKQISPTGLLPGTRVKKAQDLAREIEKDFDENIPLQGDRRFAWVFPTELKGTYKEKEAWYELSFFLPKGSYATILLEEIAHRRLKDED
ncbi:MAG: tRNA pseudouridine(13) synthase TruD [Epsilonproteobacteria bacterium]|nr:tRNA pseudouridine(13) synthase TruD [Campylobacterota bacterium]